MSDAPLPSSFDDDVDYYNENRLQKFTRRLKEEPLIPFGIAITCWALYNAQQSMRTGNSVKTNRFFRYRLYAQSFTLVAMIGGSLYYKSDRLKRGEYVKLKEKQKAQEKREKWIRELEIRDQEDTEWRAKLGKIRDLQREEDERLAVLEMQQKRAMSDDGKGVMAQIRQATRQNREEKGVADVAEEFSVPRVDRPPPALEGNEQGPERSKYKSILGESEQGGLLGLWHLKGFYEHRIKPAFGAVPQKEDKGPGKAEGDKKQ